MRAAGHMVNGAQAVQPKRFRDFGYLRGKQTLGFFLGKRIAVQVGRLLAQYGGIAGDLYVQGRHIGQKQLIIADAGAHPVSRRMPPVLHVTLLKLMRGAFQQVRACRVGSGVQQGQHILQLIPIAKRAARLIESRAHP